MRRLLPIVLVAAGCGIGSFNQFRDQLDARWCERQIRCGEVGGTDGQQHCTVPDPYVLVTRGSAADVPAAIAAHRMLFHPDNAGECLDAVKHAPCDRAQAFDDFVRHCHGVVTAGVAKGGTCWADEECVGGLCIGPDCGGTCTAYAQPGGACMMGGSPDVTCDPSVHFCGASGTCEHKVHQGDRCSDDVQCLFDFVCVAGRCADPPRTAKDDVCGSAAPPCQDGLFCDENGACEPLESAGQPCVKANACAAGMTCIGGACAPWLDVGSACMMALPTGCPASQMCSAGVCALLPKLAGGPLAHCAADGDCQDGLYCAAGNYCFYTGGINAVCQSDHECVKNLQCVAGACHTPGYTLCASH